MRSEEWKGVSRSESENRMASLGVVDERSAEVVPALITLLVRTGCLCQDKNCMVRGPTNRHSHVRDVAWQGRVVASY